MQPLFLKPIFKERIWGGTKLQTAFGYDIPSKQTGECWAISAHPHGPSVIENGRYAGMALDKLWKKHPELFGNPKEKAFPLLTKIIDAHKDLSIQVHPDDAYARVHENGEQGKTECWYVIDCQEDAYVIYGHNAKTKEELIRQIRTGQWDKLLRKVKIKPGDFFYVPSGTLHALCEGTLVLETQQSSDATYRVYDYGRKDANGNLRELHLAKAIDVINVPHHDASSVPDIEQRENVTVTTLAKSNFFSIAKWDVRGKAVFLFPDQYLLLSVIKGEGTLVQDAAQYELKTGAHLIIPVGFGEFEVEGNCEIISACHAPSFVGICRSACHAPKSLVSQ